jgi:hypothetical protein
MFLVRAGTGPEGGAGGDGHRLCGHPGHRGQALAGEVVGFLVRRKLWDRQPGWAACPVPEDGCRAVPDYQPVAVTSTTGLAMATAELVPHLLPSGTPVEIDLSRAPADLLDD